MNDADPPAPEDAPRPDFQLGARVTVLLNERNRTPRTGVVVRRVWHFKLRRWTFFIQENSKTIHKRYFAEDLVLTDAG